MLYRENSTLPNSTLGDIIHAIEHSVHQVKENPREVTAKDFSEPTCKIKSVFRRQMGEQERTYRVWDYSPYVFEKIRQLTGTAQDFLASFTGIDSDDEMTRSTSKSGSYFYKTKDEKYFLKTLQFPEVSALISILNDYVAHLTEYPNTFLVKIYGLWRVKDYGRDDLWVIVMGNAFPSGVKLDAVYDLKGRKAKPGSRRQENTEVKSDYDYPRIFFVEEDKQFYISQLKMDIELLRKHNRMDYSLLIGTCQNIDETFLKHNTNNNLISLRGTSNAVLQYYWINIIDILTVYNTQKKLANLFKQTVFERETLSSVDPVFYFDRFFSFMTKTLLSEDPEVQE